MSNVINKSLAKGASDANAKRRDMIIISVGVAIVAVLIFFVYSHISHPDSYAELEPMMDEARDFEMRATEYAGAFESIEDQIGEDAYFTAVEEGYEDSVEKQQEILDMLAETDEKIQAAGGITNYEELQTRKIPVESRAAAESIEEQFGKEYKPQASNNTVASTVN